MTRSSTASRASPLTTAARRAPATFTFYPGRDCRRVELRSIVRVFKQTPGGVNARLDVGAPAWQRPQSAISRTPRSPSSTTPASRRTHSPGRGAPALDSALLMHPKIDPGLPD
eukprot:12829018-Alexandrium_andersonii.AAC.1